MALRLVAAALAALGIGVLASASPHGLLPPDLSARLDGGGLRAVGADLLGRTLYASDVALDATASPRAEALDLRPLGRIEAVEVGADGEVTGAVVAVGGLLGFGAQEVVVDAALIRSLRSEGGDRLAIDLSTSAGA